jgi:hypothetical protein
MVESQPPSSGSEPDQPTVRDDQLLDSSTRRPAAVKFVAATVVGGFFFLVPIRVEGRWTIAFDVVVSTIRDEAPFVVGLYSMLVIVIAAVVTKDRRAQGEAPRSRDQRRPALG